MEFGPIHSTYFGHVTFLFRAHRGGTLLADPFWADGFDWAGHREKRLTPPAASVEAVETCDAIFVSHIHGDHFDPEAIENIHRRTGTKVIAAAEVLEALAARGLPQADLLEAGEGREFTFGELKLTTHCGYDGSFDSRGRPNKFSLTIACKRTQLLYSGDCHSLPPAVRGQRFDALFCWAPDDAELDDLVGGIRFKQFVLMHTDRFEPGAFLCNQDPAEQKRRLEARYPGIRVVVPERAGSGSETDFG
jgi:L-ascorbate metabolism protein UlaG (beta-lactamase superfamily)